MIAYREAPVKICPECYAFAYNGTKMCKLCGYFFVKPKGN